MPIIPLPDVSTINVQMFGTCEGQRIINLFQYELTSIPNPGIDYSNYLNGLSAAIIAPGGLFDSFMGASANNYELDFIRLQPVYPQRLRFIDYPQSAFGTSGSNATTANIAASIERFSRTGKRRGIGRVQIVVPAGVFDGGVIVNGAYLTKLGTLAAVIPLQLNSTSPLLTTQPVLRNTANPQPLSEPVEGTALKTTVRTMHRRTVGLGI
jgi:hypothetical protein